VIFEHATTRSTKKMITIMQDLQQVFNKFHVLILYSNFKKQKEQCKRAFPRKEERKMYHTQKTRPANPKLDQEKSHSNWMKKIWMRN
jgi:hypothetical protein